LHVVRDGRTPSEATDPLPPEHAIAGKGEKPKQDRNPWASQDDPSEDRHGCASTIVTSQLPLDLWHDNVGDPTLADAILDRLVHNAHRIELKGASMRKKKQA
jgi:hypothetical protein